MPAREHFPASPGSVVPQAPREEPVLARSRESAPFSVPSILSVAGAGLFAIAAFVFTFLDPDLTD